MSSAPPPVAASAADVARLLAAAPGSVAAASEARMLAEGDSRPIDYALGSGEADLVALLGGLKPLLRQILPEAEVAPLAARLAPLGLSLAAAPGSVADAAGGGRVVFMGRDRARAAEAAAREAEEGHDLVMGRLLGYPRCCVEAYLEAPPPRRNAAVLRRSLGRSRGPLSPRLNCLDWAVFHYVSWLPCAFDCAPSRAYADAVAAQVVKRHGALLGRRRASCPPGCRHERFVAAVDEALSAHRLLLLEDVQVSISGAVNGDGSVTVRRAWPAARDRHPEARCGDAARHAAARLAALCEAAGTVWVEGDTLWLAGEAVIATAEVLVAPFGTILQSE